VTGVPALARSALRAVPLIGVSAPEATGTVHLGLGNFHRAHAAVYTARAMAAEGGDWGIVGVANRSRGVTDAMAAQDQLYSVLQLSAEGERADVVDVHRRTLVAADQTDELLDEIASPAARIVTLTVSEHGYHRNARTGDLDVDADAIRADLADPDHPRTTIGQLAAGLARRLRAGGAPVTVLSCDNLQSAGRTTGRLVRQYLDAAGAHAELLDWLRTSVTFPNAMVDRIVPATTDRTRDRVQALLGFRDEVPVPAEDFSMWVLEDVFAAGRPAWERAGAIFTPEVEAYELVKLRLLNGSHSLIAYLGALDGQETIAAARAQDVVAGCVDAAIWDEYLPSIELPTGFDPDAYVAQLFARWANTAIGDRTARVGSHGSVKLLQRVPGPAVRMLERGSVPHLLALTVAGWICCICPPEGFDPGPVAAAMVDPARERLARATAGATDVRNHVEAILRGGFVPAELAAHDAFTRRVAEHVELVVRSGVREAAAEALASRASRPTEPEEYRL
jgi:fructuronate reductase